MRKEIKAVDLFCGVGGLTHGLVKAGIDVVAGVDIDLACEYPYIVNNKAEFWKESVETLSGSRIEEWFGTSDIKILAGCAPCQPFSTYSQGTRGSNDDKWKLLYAFQRLISETQPDIVSMENVPKLVSNQVFLDFVNALKNNDYEVTYQVMKCEEYGLPQTRRRLVLLASRLGKIEFIKPTHTQKNFKTVKSALGKLPNISAGEFLGKDKLHKSASLSELNMERIRQSIPGGTWKDWDPELVAACHRKESGKTYPSVYGRMEWDKPSPTITTQFYGFGNGRFGHPEQDRALTLREGAILQGFPKSYKFVKSNEIPVVTSVGRLIGNAVPVTLGEVIGKSIKIHLKQNQKD